LFVEISKSSITFPLNLRKKGHSFLADMLQFLIISKQERIVMNTFFIPQIKPIFPQSSVRIHDEEKERIMDRVYNSPVFQEFIKQWGDAMAKHEENVKSTQ